MNSQSRRQTLITLLRALCPCVHSSAAVLPASELTPPERPPHSSKALGSASEMGQPKAKALSPSADSTSLTDVSASSAMRITPHEYIPIVHAIAFRRIGTDVGRSTQREGARLEGGEIAEESEPEEEIIGPVRRAGSVMEVSDSLLTAGEAQELQAHD